MRLGMAILAALALAAAVACNDDGPAPDSDQGSSPTPVPGELCADSGIDAAACTSDAG